MKKFGTRLLAVVVASSMIAMPVMAAPSVDDLKEDKAAKESEVKSLQDELNSIMTKLSDLEEDLISKGEEISQAEKDLEAAEEKEQEQYEAMKKRIKFMYEEGNSTALETLVTSEDFSDLVNKAEYVQNLHTYDRNQLQEYVETKQEIADLKTTLEEDQQKMESMQVEYEEQEEEISDKSGLYSILTTILTLSWFISTCASLIFPNAVIISIVSLLAATGVLAKSAADDKKILELEASIQNLKHNIELGSLYGYTDAKKSTNTNTKTKQKDISNAKTKSKSNNIQASKAVNLDNCELVDEYLESLERKDYNDEKAKELIKK